MKIGIDLGGTNIRAGLIEGTTVRKIQSTPLQDKEQLDSTLNQLISLVRQVWDDAVKGIGVGVPSVVDLDQGIVYDVVNIPSWKEVHLRTILNKEFHVPVYINNDVNCFVLGEKYYGHGRMHSNFVGITIGTGIGAGLIFNNELYSGVNCGAGEIGYLPFMDADFERYCAANFFEQIHETTAHKTFLKAQEGDPDALELWKKFGANLGVALKSIMYAYDPEAIILGGSITGAFKFFHTSMLESMQDNYFPKSFEKIKIYLSEVEHVSMLGAAAQVDHFQRTGHKSESNAVA